MKIKFSKKIYIGLGIVIVLVLFLFENLFLVYKLKNQAPPPIVKNDTILEYIDVNNDGNLDLRIKLYDNDIREGYYYFLHNGHPESIQYIPIMSWYGDGLGIYSKRTLIKDNYLIDSAQEGKGFEIQAYKLDFDSYDVVKAKLIHRLSKDNLDTFDYDEYLERIKIIGENPENKFAQNISWSQFIKIINSEKTRSISMHSFKSTDLDLITLEGKKYHINQVKPDEVYEEVKKCGESCKYISITQLVAD